MDFITQGLLGAAIGAAGFRKSLGRRAVVAGAVCGFLPDLDVLLTSNFWEMLRIHRGFSHSLLILPFMALCTAALFYWIEKYRHPYWRWVHLSFWSLITHALLDACTAYGTQLLWPLTDTRYAWDCVSIIDPFYSLPLLLAVVVASIRKISADTAQRLSIAMVVLTTAYLCWGAVNSYRAAEMSRAALLEQDPEFEPVEVRGLPSFFNIFVFRTIARDRSNRIRMTMLSTWKTHEIRFLEYDRLNEPLLDGMLKNENVRLFDWFSGGLMAIRELRHERLEQSSDGTKPKRKFILSNLRLGGITAPLPSPFEILLEFHGDELREVYRYRAPDRPSLSTMFSTELKAIWYLFNGNPQPLFEAWSQDKMQLKIDPSIQALALPNQWEATISAFEEADRTSGFPQQATLFVGSSSIAFWKTLAQDFHDRKIVVRGFGGSTLVDVIHFQERIVSKYKPAMVVLYAGENDLVNGATPAEVDRLLKTFIARLRSAMPKTPLWVLAIKPSPARWTLWSSMQETNRLWENTCAAESSIYYVDTATPLFDATGQPNAAFFELDLLHLNDSGYRIWNQVLLRAFEQAGY